MMVEWIPRIGFVTEAETVTKIRLKYSPEHEEQMNALLRDSHSHLKRFSQHSYDHN